DEDMVDLTVELVAHPVADPGLRKQVARPVDEIVEVRNARGALGSRVCFGESLPGAEARRHVRREPGCALDLEQLRHSFREPLDMAVVSRIGLKLARLRLAELALAREHDRRKVGERPGPGGRRHLEPGLYVCDD